MNKYLVELCCCFMLNKKNRRHFREKYKNINYLEYKNDVENFNNILNKIKEDLKFYSYNNQEKIKNIKDKHKGEKCFIIGGSPSLKQLDLTKLNNSEYKIFTTGRGYKLKEQGLLHSDFHVFSDILGYDENINEIDTSFSNIVFTYSGINFVNSVKNLIYFDMFKSPINADKNYQKDLGLPLFHCETVINFALQISTYMGFKEIYFIGVDLDFKNNSGHAYKSSEGEKERQKSHSINNSELMLKGLEFATNFLEKDGIKLYNASPAGVVDCMERVNYNNLFNK